MLYPTTAYCKLVKDSWSNISSSNLSKLLSVRLLTAGSNISPTPAGFTIICGDTVYPIPAFTIFTSVILPFSTTGLSLPPIPDPIPTTSKSGGEKYSFPPNLTSVAIILPFDVTTFISASLPFCTLTLGFFSKLRISEP